MHHWSRLLVFCSTSQEVLTWLRPCLSVDPASRPSVDTLLQQPFFLRLAALEYLQAKAEEEAAQAAAEGGDAAARSSPSWLVFANNAASHPRCSHGSGSSDSSWDGLPPLVPRVESGTSQRLHELGGSEHGDEGLYSHLDPDVVEEMERLRMVVPSTR